METTEVNPKNWKALIKPSKLDVQLSDDKTYAKIIAEPLEKGYGLTLGNSLRRILLSSIRGTAVTAIQIDGVLHEFTSIKGVREDVTDIVLNVKSLALKSNSEGSKKLILDAKGPGEIKASNITPLTDIEILNPDLVICNLDENTNFHMEMSIGTGKGYISAEFNKPEDLVHAEYLLANVKSHSGKRIFGERDNRGGDELFVSLTYDDDIGEGFSIFINEKEYENFGKDVTFVAIKNGHHNALGYYLDSNRSSKESEKEIPLKHLLKHRNQNA